MESQNKTVAETENTRTVGSSHTAANEKSVKKTTNKLAAVQSQMDKSQCMKGVKRKPREVQEGTWKEILGCGWGGR